MDERLVTCSCSECSPRAPRPPELVPVDDDLELEVQDRPPFRITLIVRMPGGWHRFVALHEIRLVPGRGAWFWPLAKTELPEWERPADRTFIAERE